MNPTSEQTQPKKLGTTFNKETCYVARTARARAQAQCADWCTGVDAAFFAGTSIKSNFICGLGYGDSSKVFARSPRLSFEEACGLI
jgi:hypothetical protein